MTSEEDSHRKTRSHLALQQELSSNAQLQFEGVDEAVLGKKTLCIANLKSEKLKEENEAC